MTVDDCTRRCTNAGLTVLSAEVVGKQVCVTVAQVPTSASGLQALAQRLGVAGMCVSFGDGRGAVKVWFASERT